MIISKVHCVKNMSSDDSLFDFPQSRISANLQACDTLRKIDGIFLSCYGGHHFHVEEKRGGKDIRHEFLVILTGYTWKAQRRYVENGWNMRKR